MREVRSRWFYRLFQTVSLCTFSHLLALSDGTHAWTLSTHPSSFRLMCLWDNSHEGCRFITTRYELTKKPRASFSTHYTFVFNLTGHIFNPCLIFCAVHCFLLEIAEVQIDANIHRQLATATSSNTGISWHMSSRCDLKTFSMIHNSQIW